MGRGLPGWVEADVELDAATDTEGGTEVDRDADVVSADLGVGLGVRADAVGDLGADPDVDGTEVLADRPSALPPAKTSPPTLAFAPSRPILTPASALASAPT